MVLQEHNVLNAFTIFDLVLHFIVFQAFVGIFLGRLCLSGSLCVALVAFFPYILLNLFKSVAVVLVSSRSASANLIEICRIEGFVLTKFHLWALDGFYHSVITLN